MGSSKATSFGGGGGSSAAAGSAIVANSLMLQHVLLDYSVWRQVRSASVNAIGFSLIRYLLIVIGSCGAAGNADDARGRVVPIGTQRGLHAPDDHEFEV